MLYFIKYLHTMNIEYIMMNNVHEKIRYMGKILILLTTNGYRITLVCSVKGLN